MKIRHTSTIDQLSTTLEVEFEHPHYARAFELFSDCCQFIWRQKTLPPTPAAQEAPNADR